MWPGAIIGSVGPRRASRARGGFTLIETVLAMVLGSMVLAGCLAVFLAMRNVETVFAARYARTSELDTTRTVMTRALLSLQMEETKSNPVVRSGVTAGTDNPNVNTNEAETRDRIILETDPTVNADQSGWTPQRFELVCATPPVPPGMATQAASWYTVAAQSDSLDFSAMDGSQGITRGVFELRPAGQRERIMHNLGLVSAGDPILDEVDLRVAGTIDPYADPDWTLWWRPILPAEGEQLLAGLGPYPDTHGDPNEIRARLAGSVPLLRHIQRCIWELYKGDEFITTHHGKTMSDLPAYAQLEVILTNSQYASWMFEIDWVVGDDPSTGVGAGAGAGDPGTGDGDDATPPGGGPGGGGRPGGGQRPGTPGNGAPGIIKDIGGGR